MKTWTIDAIKLANRNAGLHWFDPGSLRFFSSRIGQTVYQGPGGVYFVSSEQFKSPRGDGPRRFTVRCFDPETREVQTHGGHAEGFQAYDSGRAAAAAAKRAAAGQK